LTVSPFVIVEEITKDRKDNSDKECYCYETAEDIPDPRDLSSEYNNFITLDDLYLEI